MEEMLHVNLESYDHAWYHVVDLVHWLMMDTNKHKFTTFGIPSRWNFGSISTCLVNDADFENVVKQNTQNVMEGIKFL